MIMRITWGKVHPGKWSEYERTYHATVVARTKGLKGLRGRCSPSSSESSRPIAVR